MSYQNIYDQDMDVVRETIINSLGVPEEYLTGRYPEITKFAVMIELNGERTLLGICSDIDNDLKLVVVKCRTGDRMQTVFSIPEDTVLVEATAEDLLELGSVDEDMDNYIGTYVPPANI